MASQCLAFRAPADLITTLQAQASAEQVDLSTFIRFALSAYLTGQPGTPSEFKLPEGGSKGA